MLEPYQMVAVNLIASGITATALLIYRYVYPKKKINLLMLLLIISLLPLISILRKGTYESGGFSDYVMFSISFYQALSEGILIPQWDAYRCGGYGCPQFTFMYILPYYLISLFHFFGLSFIASTKLLLASTYVLSGITMYFFAKSWLGKTPAFVAAIFYLFAPYHLVDMHFRTDIAEVLCFTLLPLQFLAAKKVVESGSKLWISLGSLVFACLILSHQAISLTSLPFVLAYGIVIWKIRKKRKIINLILFLFSILLGTLLSAFYWLPILIQGKYIYYGVYYAISFISPITMFIYSSWRLGFLYQGPQGELSFILGYFHWLITAISIVFLIRKKIKGDLKIITIFLLASFALFFFMMQEVSRPIWEGTPIISKFQFAYRNLLFLAFITALIAGIVSKLFNKKIIILLCFFTIIITILNWGHRRTIPSINDDYLKKELITSSIIFEVTIPNEADYKNIEPWHIDSPTEVIKGHGIIKQTARTTTKHEYIINAITEVKIREKTFYFPGWELYINNKQYPFISSLKASQGFIEFTLPRGLYKAEVKYTQPDIHTYSQLLSLLALIIIAVIAKKNFQ